MHHRVVELLDCDLAEIIVLVGGAIPPPVPLYAAGANQYYDLC